MKPGTKPTHGHTVDGKMSREYRSWEKMKQRCTNPKRACYPDYGGRGITVCERWMNSFENFLADMGPRPPNTTLDRFPDNDGNYEKSNCRWGTKAQQSNNTRRNRKLTFSGRTQTLTEWANEVGLHPRSLFNRIDRGWPVDIALTTPLTRGHRPQFHAC